MATQVRSSGTARAQGAVKTGLHVWASTSIAALVASLVVVGGVGFAPATQAGGSPALSAGGRVVQEVSLAHRDDRVGAGVWSIALSTDRSGIQAVRLEMH